MINYVCKYAPVELFKGFGQECAVLEEMPENFDKSDKIRSEERRVGKEC